MKTYLKYTAILLSTIFICGIFNSCANREETVSCFPNTNINVFINLNLPAYQALQNVGGWTYINEQESGTKGLILVNTSNGFIAYDRNAPHICPDANTQLKVVDGIKIVCPKDNAEWILLTGQPIAVASISPKRYYVSYNPSNHSLNITN